MELMQQSSFAQGMVSSYQQNLQTTNQQYQSVIWLENFDPNIISGSLVRRAGWVLKNYEQLGNDDGRNNSLYKYVVGSINNQDILSIGPDDIVLGAFEFQHTRPVIHTMPINIIAKSNSVIVEDKFCTPFKSHLVSYYPIEKNGQYESQWNEPTIHRNIDDGNNTEKVGKVSDLVERGDQRPSPRRHLTYVGFRTKVQGSCIQFTETCRGFANKFPLHFCCLCNKIP